VQTVGEKKEREKAIENGDIKIYAVVFNHSNSQ
jgi:hypothetical protein